MTLLGYLKALLPVQALEIQPSDKGCLVSRSKCYLKLGDPHNALKDAEAALEEDKEFNKVRQSNAISVMKTIKYVIYVYNAYYTL